MQVIKSLPEPDLLLLKTFMNVTLAESLRLEAEALLNRADQELCRPGKDVVSLCACQCIRQSAEAYMRSYLCQSGDPENPARSLADLQAACMKLDPRFRQIDLTCFDCRHDEQSSAYCLEINKVSKCHEQAARIRELMEPVPNRTR